MILSPGEANDRAQDVRFRLFSHFFFPSPQTIVHVLRLILTEVEKHVGTIKNHWDVFQSRQRLEKLGIKVQKQIQDRSRGDKQAKQTRLVSQDQKWLQFVTAIRCFFVKSKSMNTAIMNKLSLFECNSGLCAGNHTTCPSPSPSTTTPRCDSVLMPSSAPESHTHRLHQLRVNSLSPFNGVHVLFR